MGLGQPRPVAQYDRYSDKPVTFKFSTGASLTMKPIFDYTLHIQMGINLYNCHYSCIDYRIFAYASQVGNPADDAFSNCI